MGGTDLQRIPAEAPANVGALERMAEAVVRGGFWPAFRNKEQALALMLLCQAEGLHPMQAIRRFHIIEGQPSMRADAMLAEFQRRGGRVRWLERTAERCTAHFSHPELNPEGAEIVVTLKELVESGVAKGRDGIKQNYRRFPRQMLTARAISEGVRLIDPGVVSGIYTPEEVSDFGDRDRPLAEVHDPDTGESRLVDPTELPRSELPDGGSPRTDRAYREWQSAFLGDLNDRWRDYWTTRLDGDTRGVPETFLDAHRLSGHLVKHYGGPSTQNSNHRVRFLGIRLRDDGEEFVREATEYARTVFVEQAAKVRKDLSLPSDDDEPGDPDYPDPEGAEAIDPEEAELDRQAARDAGQPAGRAR